MGQNNKESKSKDILGIILSIAVAEGVGALAAFLTKDAMEDYQCLKLPSFSPPGWVVPVVWAVLFLMMGVAAYLVYKRGFYRLDVQKALFDYGAQLFFNFMWSAIFFAFNLRETAFFWILGLLGLIAATTIRFGKIDKKAGLLMLPYLFWVCFAAVLNFYIWQLNK